MRFLLIVFALFFSGCAAIVNQPNQPFLGALPEISNIESSNPELASELRKLPELQDGISPDERIALQRISEYYISRQDDIDAMFREMDQIGIKNNRKYNSPLQAFFWLAQEGPLTEDLDFISPFSLQKLLRKSWTFQVRFSDELADRVVSAIKNEELEKEYRRYLQTDNKYLFNMLKKDLRLNPDNFEDWVPDEIKRLEKAGPWSNYGDVVDRLNAPELIDYYVQENISYTNYWQIAGYNGYGPGDPHYVFHNKKGDCLYISSFIAHALSRNGYFAWIDKKPPMRASDSFHAVCAYEDGGNTFIIDDGRIMKRGIFEYDDY